MLFVDFLQTRSARVRIGSHFKLCKLRLKQDGFFFNGTLIAGHLLEDISDQVSIEALFDKLVIYF